MRFPALGPEASFTFSWEVLWQKPAAAEALGEGIEHRVRSAFCRSGSLPDLLDSCLLAVSSLGRRKKLRSLGVRTLIPPQGPTLMTSSRSNYLPKAPPPNTVALGVGVLIYEFAGNTNIQSIINT